MLITLLSLLIMRLSPLLVKVPKLLSLECKHWWLWSYSTYNSISFYNSRHFLIYFNLLYSVVHILKGIYLICLSLFSRSSCYKDVIGPTINCCFRIVINSENNSSAISAILIGFYLIHDKLNYLILSLGHKVLFLFFDLTNNKLLS